MRAPAVVWLLLFAAYAATLGIDTAPGAQYAGDEPRHLAIAAALADDGRILREPQGIGLALVITPAHAAAGATGAALLVAALTALAFALALALARQVAREPHATVAVLALGLSPPALAMGTSVSPEGPVAALLTGAALLALRVRATGRAAPAYAAATALALVPWLGTWFILVGLPVAVLAVRWSARRGRTIRAWFVAEIMAGSLVVYAMLNEALYGSWTPDAPGPALGELPRLAGIWIDREAGLLRWAPVAALAFAGAFALWRSRADRVARAIPDRRDAEVAAGCAALVCLAAIAAAVVGPEPPAATPAPHLLVALPAAAPLVAWGLQRSPRAGSALVALTAVATAWLLVDLARGAAGGWTGGGSDAPLGPLVDALPRTASWAALAVLAAAVLVAAAIEWRRAHRVRALPI